MGSTPWSSVGMAMGRGKAKGWGLRPRLAWFCLTPSLPHPAPPRMMRKTFSPHLRPLGPREAPPHPVKLYCLLIYPTTSTIFLMKPISLIKIFLKLQLNLSHKIKSIFRKKLNNISKCLTRQSLKKKKKNHSITHNKIKAKNHIG